MAEPAKPGGKSQPEQAGILVLGKTAATLAEVLVPLIIVRLITKNEVGVLTSLLLIFQTMTMIGASGYPRTLLYFLPNRPRGDRAALARRVLLVLSGLGVVAALLLFGFGALSARQHFELLALYVLLELPTRMLPNLLIVEGRARAAAGVGFFKSLGVTGATLLPAALGSGVAGILMSVVGFAALYLSLQLVVQGMLYRGAGPAEQPVVGFGTLSRFALPLGMTDIVNILNKGLDRFLVLGFFTTVAFAEYQVGAWQIPIITTIAYSVGTLYLPQFKQMYDRGEQRQAVGIWRQSILKVSLIVVPITVGFFVAAEELIALLFTDNYLQAVPIFRWYALFTLGRVAFYGAPILAAGKTRYILYASAFTLLSNLVISTPLAWLIGFQGPAMGTALAFIPTVVFYCYFIAKSTGVGYWETFPLHGYLRVVVVAALAGAVGWVIKGALVLPALASLLLVVFVVLAVFGLLGSLLGMITRGDWTYAYDWLRLKVLRD